MGSHSVRHDTHRTRSPLSTNFPVIPPGVHCDEFPCTEGPRDDPVGVGVYLKTCDRRTSQCDCECVCVYECLCISVRVCVRVSECMCEYVFMCVCVSVSSCVS